MVIGCSLVSVRSPSESAAGRERGLTPKQAICLELLVAAVALGPALDGTTDARCGVTVNSGTSRWCLPGNVIWTNRPVAPSQSIWAATLVSAGREGGSQRLGRAPWRSWSWSSEDGSHIQSRQDLPPWDSHPHPCRAYRLRSRQNHADHRRDNGLDSGGG